MAPFPRLIRLSTRRRAWIGRPHCDPYQCWLPPRPKRRSKRCHVNIIQRGLIPVQIKAGVTVPVLDEFDKPTRDDEGKPIVTAKYSGMHALRHIYASWCINRKADGGLKLPAKVMQHRLGHSSITVTLDTYGHLFPLGDDGAELAEAERALLG